ncbi:Guanylate kinase-associated protein mar [Taenia crassiceps]|uniref:Guanylate kinase-associated protein mar n=1 Tax=Taenia crassiceps TaxID=6207 RepID=A0ABR4QQA6_9CEST
MHQGKAYAAAFNLDVIVKVTSMPRTHASVIPRTPGGVHLKFSDISADEIEFDDEIAVKSSVFRGGAGSHPKELGTSFSKKGGSVSRNPPKFILRKSTDLRKIKKIDDKIEAILASPMIEVRRRPLRQSKLFASDCRLHIIALISIVDYERTPIRVPSSKDLAAVSSRRMSAIVMSKFASFAHSLSFSEGSRVPVCPAAPNRRRTTGNPRTPLRCSACLEFGSPKYKNTPASPIGEVLSHDGLEVMDIDDVNDCENIPPLEKAEEFPHDGQPASSSQMGESQLVSSKEPTSVSEFRVLVRMEASRLSSAKAAWEDVMAEEGESIPETAVSSIRVAVGKCGLLLTKKFPFFSSLVDLTENSLRQQQDEVDVTPQQRASINDLLGMWAIISQQIADIDKSFERLRRWREVSGWALSTPPVTPARPTAAPAIEKRKGVGCTRLPRPVKAYDPDALVATAAPKFRPKGKPKRLLSSSSKSKASKMLVFGPVRHSNFSQFKTRMLGRKKLEVKGEVEDASQFNSQKRGSLATTSKRNRSPQMSVVEIQGLNTMVKEGNTPSKISRRGGSTKLVAPLAPSANESASLDKFLKASSGRKELQLSSSLEGDITSQHRRQSKTPGLSRGTKISVDSIPQVPTDASANTTEMKVAGDSFVVPRSRPRRRVCKENVNISTPQSAVTINASRRFSPSSRPATGTPRPHLSRYPRVAREISFEHSPVSKSLMAAASCGNSMAGTLSANLTDGDKKSAHFPAFALASTSDGFGNSRRPRPTTPHASDLVGSSRRVSRRTRRQRSSTSLPPGTAISP